MRVFLKLGGSLITDKTKPYIARHDVIRRIAREVRAVYENGDVDLLIGHGGGSFPHYPAKKYEVHRGIVHGDSWRGYVETRLAVMKLNVIVVEEFLREGVPVIPFQPSSMTFSEGGRIQEMFVDPILFVMEHGQIPVVCGDAVLDRAQGVSIASTEEQFLYLAKLLKPDRIVLAGTVDGVYTKDPLKHDDAEKIPRIDGGNIDVLLDGLGGSHGIDVTGGMKTKVLKMYELAEETGAEVLIVSGEKGGNIRDALNGKHVGTLITR